MLKKILFFLFYTLGLQAIATTQVTIDLPWNGVYENTPFPLTISVTHDLGDKINDKSFQINGKGIQPKYQKSIRISQSSPLEIAVYEWQMEGQPPGLAILPAISVEVGKARYSSVPSGYEIKTIGSQTKGAPFLELQTVYEGAAPLYPGQRAFIGYRYLYNVSVDLSEETLPLLDAEGFKKLGDKHIDEGEAKGVSSRQVVQEVQAIKPGKYSFGPSKISGYAYKTLDNGTKQYIQPALTSAVDSFVIEVVPFPAEKKPASFNGALGSFNFSVELKSSPKVSVGDKILLLMTIQGEGELSELKAPDLCCQPGFSGNFKQSDLPPVTDLHGNTKTFLIELTLVSGAVDSVPPIQFSFFDPAAGFYEVIYSNAIPLQVSSQNKPQPVPSTSVDLKETQSAPASLAISYVLSPPVSLFLLSLIGLGAVLVKSQFSFYKEEVALAEKPPASLQLYTEALQFKDKEERFYSLVDQSLHAALSEGSVSREKILALLTKIERARYAKEGQVSVQEVILEMDRLYT